MKEDILVEIGLSRNEAKVYCALIEIGLSSAGKIAEKSGVHRANVYDALERLIEKGAVSFVIKENIKLFEPTDPKNLLGVIKEKENMLRNILPEFELARKINPSKSETQIFEGVTAFMRILHNMLEYNDEILVYGIPNIAPEMLKTKIPHFHKLRISKKIWMKHIYNYSAKERIDFLNKMPYTTGKSLPVEYNSQVSTNICGDEVVLAIWVNPMVSIRIKNSLVADAYRKYFYLLYDASR